MRLMLTSASVRNRSDILELEFGRLSLLSVVLSAFFFLLNFIACQKMLGASILGDLSLGNAPAWMEQMSLLVATEAHVESSQGRAMESKTCSHVLSLPGCDTSASAHESVFESGFRK